MCLREHPRGQGSPSRTPPMENEIAGQKVMPIRQHPPLLLVR